MQQVICPLDGKPCEADCPDRYKDEPEGGCILTTAQEMGFSLVGLGSGNIGMLYVPGTKEKEV